MAQGQSTAETATEKEDKINFDAKIRFYKKIFLKYFPQKWGFFLLEKSDRI